MSLNRPRGGTSLGEADDVLIIDADEPGPSLTGRKRERDHTPSNKYAVYEEDLSDDGEMEIIIGDGDDVIPPAVGSSNSRFPTENLSKKVLPSLLQKAENKRAIPISPPISAPKLQQTASKLSASSSKPKAVASTYPSPSSNIPQGRWINGRAVLGELFGATAAARLPHSQHTESKTVAELPKKSSYSIFSSSTFSSSSSSSSSSLPPSSSASSSFRSKAPTGGINMVSPDPKNKRARSTLASDWMFEGLRGPSQKELLEQTASAHAHELETDRLRRLQQNKDSDGSTAARKRGVKGAARSLAPSNKSLPALLDEALTVHSALDRVEATSTFNLAGREYDNERITRESLVIMGLAPSATATEIRKRYLLLAKILHPDKHADGSETLRSQLTNAFNRVTEAHDLIKPA